MPKAILLLLTSIAAFVAIANKPGKQHQEKIGAIRFNELTDSELQVMYPFLNIEANEIHNLLTLRSFYNKLRQLSKTNAGQVRVVHVGDSHIQADYFSGEVRKLLQNKFGNAGRGFVFPYRAAGTNGPPDYKALSSGIWQGTRCIYSQSDIPFGLGGITLQTESANAYFQIELLSNETNNFEEQWFDKIKVFSMPGADYFDLGFGKELGIKDKPSVKSKTVTHKVKSGESLGLIALKYNTTIVELKRINHIKRNLIKVGQTLKVRIEFEQDLESNENLPLQDDTTWQLSSGGFIHEMQLKEPINKFYLRNIKSNQQQKLTQLFGLSLERANEKGILYHSIGVNGAQLNHFGSAPYFIPQLKMLKPDLIILSFGTNESYASNLTPELFEEQLRSFLQQIGTEMPEVAVLICSQPDTYLKKKYPNEKNKWIKETYAEVAEQQHLAFWDLNTVMGGFGSMDYWYKAGLGAKDKIHFQKDGYRLQGNLLFNALIKNINSTQN